MTDYGALADKLKAAAASVKPSYKRSAEHGTDPAAFYESVKAQIEEEVEKANVELCKRRLPTIERIFTPSFLGKLSLTFGTDLLCYVDLQEEKGRIIAVILGPPNRCEISRKEYFLYPEAAKLQDLPEGAAELQAPPEERVEKVTVGYSPDRIATEIVTGLLMMGEFA